MMKPEEWRQIESLFHAAAGRDPGERASFLAAACGEDEALRREVESLLAAHERAGSFIEKPALEVEARSLADEQAGATDERSAEQTIGHYSIAALLGSGGMGDVYLAHDTRLGRQIALKLLPADYTKDADRLRRFEQEARAASALNHPNIITIHEIGQFEGRYFIAAEYVEGTTLRERLADGAMKLTEALDVIVQVASALETSHAKGIIHRDIKPENIMLRRDGYVKVLDFGLAKLTEGVGPGRGVDPEAPTRALAETAPGMVMGTPRYMSPEQARGVTVDARTDVWSLGCVLYEMVTGRAPFEGATFSDVIASVLGHEPPPLARYAGDAPFELEWAVRKSLRKDRDERYQTVREMLSDLKSLKLRLEFEAELERATPHGRGSEAERAETSGGSAGGTSQIAAQTGDASPARATSGDESVTAKIRRRKPAASLILATLAAVIVAAVYFTYSRFFPVGGEADIRSIAVLPFANESGNPAAEYLADGVSEGVINNLSQLPQLKVIARSSSFKYKGKEIDPQEVANALGVRAVVTGRIAQRGDNLEISVEMMDARDKTVMWGERYNCGPADIQTAEGEIARAIAEKLRVRLTGEQARQLMKPATENPEAYQLYLNGEIYSRKGTTEDQVKALGYYTQATTLDANFARAYIGIAGGYLYLGNAGALDPQETQPKAKAAVEKALQLDETLAPAHAMLGTIKVDEWDWAGAEVEFKRAVELNPNLAQAHGMYAFYLTPVGRHTEALAEVRRAEELDPLTMRVRFHEGTVLYNARRYDEAIRQLQNVINLQPDYKYAHEFMGFAYAMKGRYEEAVAEYQKFSSIEGETTSNQIYLGYAYAMSGKRDEALAILDKLKATDEYVSPAELAILYAGLGDKEGAFQSLERAYAVHDLQLQYLKVEPHYDPLRDDPRFQNLLHRVGFAP
jgi:eukaryotic-like serine/threonine-protein kinase